MGSYPISLFTYFTKCDDLFDGFHNTFLIKVQRWMHQVVFQIGI